MSGGKHPKAPEPPAVGSVREFGYSDVEQGERIGAGGDADVYRATVKKDGYSGTVALKTPRFEGTVSKQVVERFEKEAETWDKLSDGENVVSVYSWGTEPIPWLALEYMDAGTLESKIGKVGVEEALWISGRVADGVYHGHRHGVAHLDIKPTNVLLRETGAGTWDYPKVSDWGLAKMLLDHSNSIEGISPTYAAPEQFDSEQYGATDDITDVYQIGAVAYALLTGEPPFTGSSAAVMQGVLQEEPTPPSVANPDVPREVDEVVMKALSKEKGDRYESSVILRKELEGLFEGYVDGSLGASVDAGATAGGSAATSGASADRGRSGSGRKTGEGTGTGRKETSDSRTEQRSTAEAESRAETDRRSRERKDSTSDGGGLTRRRALGLLGVGAAGVGGWWLSAGDSGDGGYTEPTQSDPTGTEDTNPTRDEPRTTDSGGSESTGGGTTSLGDVVAQDQLIAHWPFQDGFQDVMGNNDASADYGSPTIGNYSGRTGVSFEGDSALRVSRGDHGELSRMCSNCGPSSFSMWVYFDKPTGDGGTWDGREEDGKSPIHSIYVNEAGSTVRAVPIESSDIDINFGVAKWGDATGYGTGDTRVSRQQIEEWHHISIIANPTESVTVYVNGDEQFSDNSMGGYSNNQDYWTDITIGGGYAGNPEEWLNMMDGKISDLRIYGTALSEEQVSQIYTNTA